MDDIFAHKDLGVHFGDHHLPFFSKDNDIINVATIGHIFVPFQGSSDESLFPVHIEFGIADDHFGGLDVVKDPDL